MPPVKTCQPPTLTDAWVDDFFALAGEGQKPRCPHCLTVMNYCYEHDSWECPRGLCGERDNGDRL